MTTPTEAQQDFLNQAEFFRGEFESEYNIPTAGRSPYQKWLSNQWQIPATEYILDSRLGPGPTPTFPGQPTIPPQTFRGFLGARRRGRTLQTPKTSPSRLRPGYLDMITGPLREYPLDRAFGEPSTERFQKDPQAQRELLEHLPGYVGSTAFYGGLQGRYPNFIAQGLASQAFGAPQRRAFDISEGAIEGDSFLNFVRQRYGI